DEMPRVLEGQLEPTVCVPPRQATRVIPVQMRGNDSIHLVWADAQSPQRIQHLVGLAQADLSRAFLAQLVADPGLADDYPAVLASDEANAGHVDHVVAVSRLLFLPQHLGDDAEHQPSVR